MAANVVEGFGGQYCCTRTLVLLLIDAAHRARMAIPMV